MEKERKGSIKKVMVAIDESNFSYNALIWVLDNLKDSFTDTPLVIFATQPLANFSYAVSASVAGFYFPLSPSYSHSNSTNLSHTFSSFSPFCLNYGFG